MKNNLLVKLASIADKLDEQGFKKEADAVDGVIKSLASKDSWIDTYERVENGEVECYECGTPYIVDEENYVAVCPSCGNTETIDSLDADREGQRIDDAHDYARDMGLY